MGRLAAWDVDRAGDHGLMPAAQTCGLVELTFAPHNWQTHAIVGHLEKMPTQATAACVWHPRSHKWIGWPRNHSCDLGGLPNSRYTVAVLVAPKLMYSSAEYCRLMKNASVRRRASGLSWARSLNLNW